MKHRPIALVILLAVAWTASTLSSCVSTPPSGPGAEAPAAGIATVSADGALPDGASVDTPETAGAADVADAAGEGDEGVRSPTDEPAEGRIATPQEDRAAQAEAAAVGESGAVGDEQAVSAATSGVEAVADVGASSSAPSGAGASVGTPMPTTQASGGAVPQGQGAGVAATGTTRVAETQPATGGGSGGAARGAMPSARGSVEPEPLGVLSYFQASVSVRRADQVFAGDDVDFGFSVKPFDLVTTGPASYAEVDLNASYPGGALVRISEKTAFYFDVAGLDAPALNTDLRLLAGSVALKVQKLGGTGSVRVSTETTAFGVRGTEFIISAAPEGSLLVTCLEGRVACDDGSGNVAYADAGGAVERRRDGELRVLSPLEDGLGYLRTAWLAERKNSFLADPALFAAPYLGAAGRYGPEFDAAVGALNAYDDVWRGWDAAVQAGRLPSFMESAADKKRVNGALFSLAKALFFYEPVHYRLLDMLSYPEVAASESRLDDGRTLGAAMTASRETLRRREAALARARRVFYLYGAVSDGSPLGEFFADRAGGAGWDLLQ